jgi:hypothetical protein
VFRSSEGLPRLAEGHCLLPQDAQRAILEVHCTTDFFYAPNVCVFCDGSVHDDPLQAGRDVEIRRELIARGYRVVPIRYDQNLIEQVAERPDLFGLLPRRSGSQNKLADPEVQRPQ